MERWWFCGREFPFGNSEFETLAHGNLTLQSIVDNNSGRHVGGRDVTWGVAYRTGKGHLHKVQCVFLPNTHSDTIRTGTTPAYPATTGGKVEEAHRGQGVSTPKVTFSSGWEA